MHKRKRECLGVDLHVHLISESPLQAPWTTPTQQNFLDFVLMNCSSLQAGFRLGKSQAKYSTFYLTQFIEDDFE